MIRHLCLILFFAIYSFAAWNGEISEPKIAGNIYQISSPAELAWFAEQVNNGKTELNAELTGNILFGSDSTKYSNTSWPIVGSSKENAFKGTFEGNDHIIYGLNMVMGSSFSYGLFGYLDSQGTIRNVTVAYSRINLDFQGWDKDSVNAGLLVGHSDGSIYNCHTREGSIAVSDGLRRYAKGFVGGLVGVTTMGSIEKVTNHTPINIDVYGNYFVGGLVGQVRDSAIVKDAKNYAEINVKGDTSSTYIGYAYNLNSYVNMLGDKHENHVGGIVGFSNSKHIDSCENYGNIYTNFGNVGGIAGRALVLNDVENHGTITDTLGIVGGIAGYYSGGDNWVNYGNVYGYFAGGIIGLNSFHTTSVNKGSVHGTMLAGGIIAWGGVSTAKNEGKVTGKIAGGISGWLSGNIEYVINLSGDIKGDSLTGALAGYVYSQINHAYYNKDLLPDMGCFGGTPDSTRPLWCEGLTTDSLKRREFVGMLNEDYYFNYRTERIWSYVPGEYPEFKREGFQEAIPVTFDDGKFITTDYTDYQGKLGETRIPVSEDGHYFSGWVDEDGNPVDKNHIFKDSAALFARYSETIEDSSLVVYEQPSFTPEFRVWNGVFKKSDKQIRKDGRLYYAIYTPAELKWFIDDAKGASGILMNDIVLGKDSLTPTSYDLYNFYRHRGFCDTCIFDGNNHTIYGPRHSLFDTLGAEHEYWDASTQRYTNRVSDALVQNLKIRSSLIEGYAGAIARINFGSIRNCSVQGLPMDTASSVGGLVYKNDGVMDSVEFIFDSKQGELKNYNYKIGGIVSYNSYRGKVTNALTRGYMGYYVNNGSVAMAGGVVDNWGLLKNFRNEASFDIHASNVELAGIVLHNNHFLINAVNTGDIYGTSRGYRPLLAGIAVTNDSLVDSCSSNGFIHLAYSMYPGSDSAATAGIVALNYKGFVKNAMNKGRVLMEDASRTGYYPNKYSVGGIVGINWGIVDSAENKKPVLHECPYFYNECEYNVEGKNSTFAIGGIVGKNHNEVKNSKNFARVAGFSNVGGIAGISDSILTNVNNRGPVYGISVVYEYYAYYNDKEPHIGGIAGECNLVDGAYNEASIFYAYANQEKNSYVGGVCGSLSGSMNRASNIGDIFSEDNVDSSLVAGIVADVKPGASITNAFNWGNLTSRRFAAGVWGKGDSISVKNVYSTAKVDAKQIQSGVYVFALNYEENHEKNPYVYYDSSAVNDSYSVTFYAPMSSELMKTDDFKDALNTTAGTEESSMIWTRTDGYPVFAGFEMIPMSSYYEEPVSSSSAKSSSSVASSSSVKSSSSEASSSSVKSSSSVASSSSIKSSSSEASSSSINSSSSAVSSSSAKSSSSEASSSSVKSSSSKESSSSSADKIVIPVTMKPARFAVNVAGRIINIHGTDYTEYVLTDLQGRILKSGLLYKGTATIEMNRSGNYVLHIDGTNQLVRIR